MKKSEKIYLCLLDISKLVGYGFKKNQQEVLTLLSKFLNLIPRDQLYLDFYDKYFEYVILLKKLVFSKSDLNEEIVAESLKEFVDYFTNIEGIKTAQGYLADQVKQKIKELLPQSKYRVITTLSRLNSLYEAKAFPEITITNDFEKEAFSTLIELEELQD